MIEELRIKEWADKFFLVMICCLIASPFPKGNIFLLFGIYLATILQYTYLLNSYCDRDRKIFREKTTVLLLYLLGGLSFIIPVMIDFSNITIIMTMVTLFFATFYSLPPLRFKKRGFLGLTGAFVQYTLPFLVFCSLFSAWDRLTVFLAIYLSLIAAIKLIVHQIDDYDEDKGNNIRTLVIQIGKTPSKMISYLLIFLLVFSYSYLFVTFPFDFSVWTSVLLLIFSVPSFQYIKRVMLYET